MKQLGAVGLKIYLVAVEGDSPDLSTGTVHRG